MSPGRLDPLLGRPVADVRPGTPAADPASAGPGQRRPAGPAPSAGPAVPALSGFGTPSGLTPVTSRDVDDFVQQLGRPPRGALAVAYRCRHDVPAVVLTAPRLPDGTPFPTSLYLCCAALNAAVSRMEAAGVMREMTDRLGRDDDLAARYGRAHVAYLHLRDQLGDLGIDVSAGGMPDRVKCLHVLVAHALAAGPGVNPLGDEAVALLPEYFRSEPPCVPWPQSPADPVDGPAAPAATGIDTPGGVRRPEDTDPRDTGSGHTDPGDTGCGHTDPGDTDPPFPGGAGPRAGVAEVTG